MKRHIALLLAALCVVNVPAVSPIVHTNVMALGYTSVLQKATIHLSDGSALDKYKIHDKDITGSDGSIDMPKIADLVSKVARAEVLNALTDAERFVAEEFRFSATTSSYAINTATPEAGEILPVGFATCTIVIAAPSNVRDTSSTQLIELQIPIYANDPIADAERAEFQALVDKLKNPDFKWNLNMESTADWIATEDTITDFYTKTLAYAQTLRDGTEGGNPAPDPAPDPTADDLVIDRILPDAFSYRPVQYGLDGRIAFSIVAEGIGLVEVIEAPILKPPLLEEYQDVFDEVVTLLGSGSAFLDYAFLNDSTDAFTAIEDLTKLMLLENVLKKTDPAVVALEREIIEYIQVEASEIIEEGDDTTTTDVFEFTLNLKLVDPDGRVDETKTDRLQIASIPPVVAPNIPETATVRTEYNRVLAELKPDATKSSDWGLNKAIVDSWATTGEPLTNEDFYSGGTEFAATQLAAFIDVAALGMDFELHPLKSSYIPATGDIAGTMDFIFTSAHLNQIEQIRVIIEKPDPVGDYNEVLNLAIEMLMSDTMLKDYQISDTRMPSDVALDLSVLSKAGLLNATTGNQRALAEYINFEFVENTTATPSTAINYNPTISRFDSGDIASKLTFFDVRLTLTDPVSGEITTVLLEKFAVPVYTVTLETPLHTAAVETLKNSHNAWGLNIINTESWSVFNDIEGFYSSSHEYLDNKYQRLLGDINEIIFEEVDPDDPDAKPEVVDVVKIIDQIIPIAKTYTPATASSDGFIDVIIVSTYFSKAETLTIPINLAPEYQEVFNVVTELVKPPAIEDPLNPSAPVQYEVLSDDNVIIFDRDTEEEIATGIEQMLKAKIMLSDELIGDMRVMAEDVEFDVTPLDYDAPQADPDYGFLEFHLTVSLADPINNTVYTTTFPETATIEIHLKVGDLEQFDNLAETLNTEDWGLNSSITGEWSVENDSASFYEDGIQFGSNAIENILNYENFLTVNGMPTNEYVIDKIYPLAASFKKATTEADGELRFTAVSTYFNTTDEIIVVIPKPDTVDPDPDPEPDDKGFDPYTFGLRTTLELTKFDNEYMMRAIDFLVKESIRRNTIPELRLDVGGKKDFASLELHGGVLNTLLLSDRAILTVVTKAGTIEFSTNALRSILNEAVDEVLDEDDESSAENIIIPEGKSIEITIDTDSRLTDDQDETIDKFPYWSIVVAVDGTELDEIEGVMELLLPYDMEGDEPSDVYLYEVTDNGKYSELGIQYDEDDKTIKLDVKALGEFMVTEQNVRLNDLLLDRQRELEKRENDAEDRADDGFNQAYKPPTPIKNPFVDIIPTYWGYDSILSLYAQGLMSGATATLFKPNDPAARATIIDILYKIDGSSSQYDSALFNLYTDVDSDDWFADASNWARNTYVYTGFDDRTFRPYQAVTREELAMIIYNYMRYRGIGYNMATNLNVFRDGWHVSKDLIWPVGVVVYNRILVGSKEGDLRPLEIVSRVELAAVIDRLLALMNR